MSPILNQYNLYPIMLLHVNEVTISDRIWLTFRWSGDSSAASALIGLDAGSYALIHLSGVMKLIMVCIDPVPNFICDSAWDPHPPLPQLGHQY